MYYIVKSNPIKVNLHQDLKSKLLNEGSGYFEFDQETSAITFDYTDEGFELEEVAPYLACAIEKGSLRVCFEDRKGEDEYFVHFGPGFCDEE